MGPAVSERVVVAGDWHGNANTARTVIDRAAALGIHTVLHVGDLGIGPWPGDTTTMQRVLDGYLSKQDSVLLLTPGNHENWDRIEAAPTDDEGRQVLADRVLALPRGHRWQIGARTFGSLGGAVASCTCAAALRRSARHPSSPASLKPPAAPPAAMLAQPSGRDRDLTIARVARGDVLARQPQR
jgi:hypothetical protein